MVRARDCNFYGEGNNNHQLETELFVHRRIVSAVMGVDFDSDSD